MPDSFGTNSNRIARERAAAAVAPRPKILVIFGTRPEAIKLAPVVRELKKSRRLQTVVVSSSQHTDLLLPFLKIFDLKIDYDLRVMTANQTPNQVAARVLTELDAVLTRERPDLILVQGDTTTALAGALAAFNRNVKIGHVEAGLRSGNRRSPFPEEANRRLVAQLADFHFCATVGNRANLLTENVPAGNIFVCGNPVVDALLLIVENQKPSAPIETLLAATSGSKRILLTTHRRESFGAAMTKNLRILREFVERKPDVNLIFPVHPNPNVRRATETILANRERIHLLEPLDYADFAALMKAAWLIASDSGGVQEEAPSLGKPLLVLRENTERPEAIAVGVAKLAGGDLRTLLYENHRDESWINSVEKIENPFGDGRAAARIVKILEKELRVKTDAKTPFDTKSKTGAKTPRAAESKLKQRRAKISVL